MGRPYADWPRKASSVLLARGEGAASVLLVGMFVAIAVIALFGFSFVHRLSLPRLTQG